MRSSDENRLLGSRPGAVLRLLYSLFPFLPRDGFYVLLAGWFPRANFLIRRVRADLTVSIDRTCFSFSSIPSTRASLQTFKIFAIPF